MLFVVFASAATYKVKYADIGGGGSISYADTDANGKITLRETSVSTNANKEFYGWFADDGTFYKPGQEITITENINLREAYAIVVTDLAGLKDQLAQKNVWSLIRLDADLDLTESTGRPGWKDGGGAQIYLDLNGHTIEYTGTATLFTSTRLGLHLLNSSSTEAKIIANNIAENSAIIEIGRHGYGDGKNLTFSVGRNVNVETNSALYRVPGFYYSATSTGGNGDLCPYISIWGTVKARTLVNGNSQSTHLADLNIYSGANVTFTGKTWWENARPTIDAHFADLTIEAGAKITTTDLEFNWIPSDLYIKYVQYGITGGLYNAAVPSELLKYGLQCVESETQAGYYEVKLVGCPLDINGEHNYIQSESFDELTKVTCTKDGSHYFRCACGAYYLDAVEALGHDYSVLISETAATCTKKAYKTYQCSRCDSTTNVEYGSANGHDYSITTIDKIATALENGVKRKTCSVCGDFYTYEYSFDPSEQVITIVVKTENGTKEITGKVSDLFNFAISESTTAYTCEFKGIKDITDPDNPEVIYKMANVVKLAIPAGFTRIATGAIKNATVLEEIVLLDGANATFASKSIDGCTALKSIVLGDCTVTFSGNTINGSTADLTIDATKANVTTLASAFEGKTALKHFIMGTGKSYDFAASTFKTAGIEEFVVPDYATLKAAYATCFQANSLKYVYIGRGITHIDNIFDQCYYMQTIVLMDVTNITGQYFACLANKGEDVLRIYHHAYSLSVGNYFLHQSHGVILYTNATSWTGGMDRCSGITKTVNGVEITYPAYTIVKGIPHQYIEGEISATCTAMGSKGYTTDCPCGVVADATYTTYKGVSAGTATTNNNVSQGTITLDGTTPALGHEFDVANGATIVGTTEPTCLDNATTTYKCKRCDETLTVETENSALGHDTEGVEWREQIKATCTADGLQTKNCTRCKALAISEKIPATGHDTTNQNWVEKTPATCTLGAVSNLICDTCEAVVEIKTGEPAGHNTDDVEWTITVAPTCIATGTEQKNCKVCLVPVANQEIPALGHEFDVADGATLKSIVYADGYTNDGISSTMCARCNNIQETTANAIFEALGYSVGPDGYSVKMGFTVNTKALNDYKAFYPTFEFGMLFINANSVVETESFFDGNGLNATAKGIKFEIEGLKYATINADLRGFNATTASSLELVMGIYVIDENGVASVVQHINTDNYTTNKTYADLTLNAITFNQVRAAHGLEALVPAVTTGDDQ